MACIGSLIDNKGDEGFYIDKLFEYVSVDDIDCEVEEMPNLGSLFDEDDVLDDCFGIE